jgi:serine/threonine-protein kinase
MVGRLLCGKWRLERLLASGGTSEVYAATHRNGRRVAIKVLSAELAGNRSARERFLREGHIANRIPHPGVISVLDDGVDGEVVFLVMELLEGETLAARVQRGGGALAAAEVAAAAESVLEALVAAHASGIVHRDIKPQNLFLTEAGQLKLLDFGIARLNETVGVLSRTADGQPLGTPGFMAPEQARGRWDQVDARTDLWAVGATMFYLASGRPVHPAATAEEATLAARTIPVPSLTTVRPGLPPALVSLVDRALAFDPRHRWPSARQMLAAVRQLRSELSGSAPAPRPRPADAGLVTLEESLSSALPARGRAATPARTLARAVAKIARPRAGRRVFAWIGGMVAAAALAAAALWAGLGPFPLAGAPAATVHEPAVPEAERVARVYLDEAERLARDGRFRPATALLERTRGLPITDPALNITLIMRRHEIAGAATLQAAQARLRMDEPQEAIALAGRVLESDPKNVEASRLVVSARRALARRTSRPPGPVRAGQQPAPSEPEAAPAAGVAPISVSVPGPPPASDPNPLPRAPALDDASAVSARPRGKISPPAGSEFKRRNASMSARALTVR